MNLPVDRRAYYIAQSLRPQMTVLPFIIFAAVTICHDGVSIGLLLLGWLELVSIYGAVALQNDVSDIATDRLNNRSDIPLASGHLSMQDTNRALQAIRIAALVVALLINQWAVIWSVIYLFFGWLYSGRPSFKNRPYLSLIVLALCYGVMPWLLGFIATRPQPNPFTVMLIASSFLFVLFIMPLKDFKDRMGDAKTGKRTLLVVHGFNFTTRYIRTGTVVVCLGLMIGMIPYHHYVLASAAFVLASICFLTLNPNVSLRTVRGNYIRLAFFVYVAAAYVIELSVKTI